MLEHRTFLCSEQTFACCANCSDATPPKKGWLSPQSPYRQQQSWQMGSAGSAHSALYSPAKAVVILTITSSYGAFILHKKEGVLNEKKCGVGRRMSQMCHLDFIIFQLNTPVYKFLKSPYTHNTKNQTPPCIKQCKWRCTYSRHAWCVCRFQTPLFPVLNYICL